MAAWDRIGAMIGLIALMISAAAAPPETRDRPLELTVRPGRAYQVIENFGASDAWSMDPIGREWNPENKNRLADLLFSRDRGIGLSLWRFNIGAGSRWTDAAALWDPWRGAEAFKRSEEAPYDWNRQAGQQWFLGAARARGVRQFLACVYSPPVWMTVNGHACCDARTGSTNLKPGYEGPFARYLADVLIHFARQGLPFQYLSPVNEPHWPWEGGQEGNRYNNADLKGVLQALHAELARQKLNIRILAPEAGELGAILDDDLHREWLGRNDPQAVYAGGYNGRGQGKYREYIKDLLGDAALRKLLDRRISAHSYWTDTDRHHLYNLRAILRRNLDRYVPGARYWQTEYCLMEHGRDLGIDAALRVARVIHYDLTAASASAWHWWLAVSPADYKDGLIYTDCRTDGRQAIRPAKTLWALGHYSRFIRPGSRRIGLEPSEDGDLLASAYRVPPGSRLVLVLINSGPRDRRVRWSRENPGRAFVPWVTSSQEDLSPRPAVLSHLPFRIPARSIVTLVEEAQSVSRRP